MISSETFGPLAKSFMERVVFETTVKYKPGRERIVSGVCNDLSVGGLYLRTKFSLDEDEILEVSFCIPNPEQDISISCKARVAWTNFETNRRKPNYPAGVGLQFLDLTSAEKALLSKFIETYDENKKMNVLCAWCGNYLGTRKGPFGATTHGICNRCREELAPEN